MKAVPHYLASILAIATLAGCASVQEQEPQPPAQLAAANPGNEAGSTITGSRIPSRRSEKMVSQIGSQDYKDNKAALPAPLQSH
jgi:nitrous oxide reductase accessory protein NosL